MYRPVLVTPPVITPVSLEEAKAHCRATDHTDDDATLTALIAAAVSHLDGWTGILGRCLCEQTWRQDFNDFRSCLQLPLFPVVSIVSVKYVDTNSMQQTVDPGSYSLRVGDLGSYIRFATNYAFPPLNTEGPAVSIEYIAGYLDTPAVDAIEADPEADPPVEAAAAIPRLSTVPDALKHAILMLVSHWFQNRDAVVVDQAQPAELPFAVAALIAPFRRVKF